MIKISNVQLKHSGMLSDDTTKLTLYVPPCTEQQHVEIVRMVMAKTIGVILVEPELLDEITEVIRDIKHISNESGQASVDPEAQAQDYKDFAETHDNISD